MADGDSRVDVRRIVREKELGGLLLLVALFFIRPLTTGTFFFRDLYLYAFAKGTYLAEAMRTRQLPLWSPLFHGGQPFLGDPNRGLLYPSNVLYLLLPPVAAMNVLLVLQFLLCALFAYRLARVLDISATGAFIAGASFTFSGYVLSSANVTVPLLGFPWVALFLTELHLYLQGGARRHLAGTIVAPVLLLLAGSVEIGAVMFVTALVWVLAFPYERHSAVVRVRTVLLAGVLAAGIAAIQVVPALEVVSQSARGAKRTYESFTDWSLDPHRLPELVIPRWFGATDTLDEGDYWGRLREQSGFPYVLSIYAGALAMILALTAVLSRRTPSLPRRARVALGLIALAGVVLSLGRFLPGFRLIYDFVPFITTFRFPVKALTFAVLPIALLAAEGSERIFRDGRGRPAAIALAATGALLLAFAAMWTSPVLAAAMETTFFGHSDARIAPALWRQVLQPAGILIAAAVLVASFVRRQREWHYAVFALLVAFDFAMAGARVNPYAPRDFFDPPPLVREVKRAAGGGRFYRAADPATASIRARSNDVEWLDRWNSSVLRFYAAPAFGIRQIFHADHDGLAPRRIATLTSELERVRWRFKVPILRAAGVTTFMTAAQLSLNEVTPLGMVRNASSTPFYLYAVPDAAMARFVSASENHPTAESVLRRLTSGFDVRRSVLLESAQPSLAGSPQCSATVTALRDGFNEQSVRSSAPCAGYVVFAQTFYPGWKYTVDGEPARAERANYAFSAVRVGAGTHEIVRKYRPASVAVGLLLSFLFASLAAALVWRSGARE